MKKNPYELITDAIIKKLEQGTIPWKRPWSIQRDMPKNLVSHKEYNGINIWMLLSMGYESRYWGTFKQIKELGGEVIKGERGTPIVFWSIFSKMNEETEREERFFTLRHWTVFNFEQTKGLKRPSDDSNSPTYTNTLVDDSNAVKTLNNMPNPPKIVHQRQMAFYNPIEDIVNLPKKESFSSIEEYYSTLFHELSHSTGHKTRLNREGITNPDKFKSHKYSIEELIAEFSASYVMGSIGLLDKTIDNSASYIDGWIKVLRKNPKYLVSAASKAMKSANYILNIREDV